VTTSPPQSPPPSRLWRTLTSIRLTVSLLLILGAVATVGTVIPQHQPPALYFSRYGETLGSFLQLSGVSRIYFSPWFLLVVGLLALNILACLVHGLPQAVRRSLKRLDWETAQALPERGRFNCPAGVDPAPRVAATLRRELGRPRPLTLPHQEVFLYERGRFRPLGPYLVHLALLLVLAGGLIGKFWGMEGQLPLLVGEEAQAFETGQAAQVPLDFQVRLDRFQVQFYEEGGTPKEFRSDLTFFKDGQEKARAVCRVNEPVTFGGLTFYQASYGSQGTGPVRLMVRQGAESQSLEAPVRRPVGLPGGEGQIIVVRVDGDLQGYGPAVQLAVRRGPGHPFIFWAFQNHPNLGEQTPDLRIVPESIPFKFYSVFQVKRDPGVGWVYGGFLLFLPGLYLAFLRPPQRWAVVLEKTPEGVWKGRLLGASPRGREDFAARQERLLAQLKKGASP
jgi:cytochrome c biogenesis protein